MSRFKFLHAADIHLDSPLSGLTRYEGVPVDDVRMATRRALNNLVDYAIAEVVSFVVIAGDLFDGAWDDFSTGLFFCGAMGRLGAAGIPAYLAYGNHDADSLQTKRLPLPDNVRVFSHRAAETFIDAGSGAALHGQSYKSRDPGGDLSAGYPAAAPGRFNIGVLHTALEGGRPPHAAYSPCTVADLASKGYDYWALGHVHNREIVSASPYIVFPGNLQGRNIRECGPKGAYLITVEHGAMVSAEFKPFDTVRWSRVAVDVTGCADRGEVERKTKEALLEVIQREADGRPLIARVTLTGETELHGALSERLATFREEVRALATGISDDVWIEKVLLTTTPRVFTAAAAGDQDEITSLLDEGVDNETVTESLKADFATLFGRVLPDLADDSDLLQAAKAGNLEALLRDASASLRARLSGGGV